MLIAREERAMPDFSWFVANCAKHGRLRYYMNQSNTDPLQQPGPWGAITEGYCAGLSLRWVQKIAAGTDFQPDASGSYHGETFRWFKATDWQATVLQAKIRQYHEAAKPGVVERIQYAAGLVEMEMSRQLFADEALPPTGARLTKVVKQSYGNYYVSLRGSSAKDGHYGHAIALRHGKPPGGKGAGVFHIFDPNSGHFAWQVEAAQWAQIVDLYLYFRGYDKDYKDRYVIARLNPLKAKN
jgi:hypothetical protein